MPSHLHPTPQPPCYSSALSQTLTRSALTQLRSETKQTEIRIGIVNHTLVACMRKNTLLPAPSRSTLALTFTPFFLHAASSPGVQEVEKRPGQACRGVSPQERARQGAHQPRCVHFG